MLPSIMRWTGSSCNHQLDKPSSDSPMASGGDDPESLQAEVHRLREELAASKEEIKRLLQREQMLKERYFHQVVDYS